MASFKVMARIGYARGPQILAVSDSANRSPRVCSSPELGAAVEDAKRFPDITRTYAVAVEEMTIIG